jgi:hypothetical protein
MPPVALFSRIHKPFVSLWYDPNNFVVDLVKLGNDHALHPEAVVR